MEVLHHLQAQPLPMENLISCSDHLNNAGHSPLYAGNPWDVNAHVLHAGKDDVCRCFCKMMVAALAQVLMMEQMLMDSLIKMVLRPTRTTRLPRSQTLPPELESRQGLQGGGGKSGGSNRKNPRDKHGQVMRCNDATSAEVMNKFGEDALRMQPDLMPPYQRLQQHFHTQLGGGVGLGVEREQLRCVSQASSVAPCATQRLDQVIQNLQTGLLETDLQALEFAQPSDWA